MDVYQFNQSKYGTHKVILSFLRRDEVVLDVGCGSGYLGEHSQENRFYGIEINKEKAQKAKEVYKEVLVGDVEKLVNFPLSFPKFDVIVFADVLEHLVNPQRTLTYFVKNYLKEGGRVIISLPNVAHLTIRLSLLFGKFDYTDTGILDKTHLHLYTLKSARELIDSVGLEVKEIAYSSNRFGWLIKKIPLLGTILGFNLIFLCQEKK